MNRLPVVFSKRITLFHSTVTFIFKLADSPAMNSRLKRYIKRGNGHFCAKKCVTHYEAT